MKKIINLLIMLFCVVSLSGCGKSETIHSERTIVLNVDTDVVPTFSSNFGTGTYDEATKKYTHTIDYIKDLYIYLTYDDLKTLTVYVPTSDMTKEVITRDVDFGSELDVEVEITVEGVKVLEGLEISDSLTYSNLIVGDKNTFKLTLPSRDNDYNIKFTLPNYREFNVDLKEEDLVSGSVKINTIAITDEQMYIGFVGNYYSYQIYSMTTNDLITSGNKWEDNGKIEYILLDNDDSYYVETQDGNWQTQLHKINQGVNIIISLENNNNNSIGYLYINSENNWFQSSMMYDKNRKTLKTSLEILDGFDSNGLLVKNSENKWFYMDSLEGKLTNNDNNNYEYYYTLDYNDFVEVSFDVTYIDTITNQIRSSGIEEDVRIFANTYAEFDNDVFTLTIYEIDDGYISIDLYTKDNEKITTLTQYISSYFKGEIYSGTIIYKQRTIPYQIPIFIEDLLYDGEKYTYPDQIIDVDVSFVEIKIVGEEGYVRTLYESDNPYVMDEDSNVIMYTLVGDNIYFELSANKIYTLHYAGKTYQFETTIENIDLGVVGVIDQSAPTIEVKIPDGYTLDLFDYDGFNLIPNQEGIITVPVRAGGNLYGRLSNGIVEIDVTLETFENITLYELEPFYVLNGGEIYSDYQTYNIGTSTSDDGVIYVYRYRYGKDTTMANSFQTNIIKGFPNGSSEYVSIDLSDFVYNEEIKAYYYDFENEFDHIITMDSYTYTYVKWSQDYYCYYDYLRGVYMVYINNGTTISYETYAGGYHISSYLVSDEDSKYLEVILNTDVNPYEIVVRSISN